MKLCINFFTIDVGIFDVGIHAGVNLIVLRTFSTKVIYGRHYFQTDDCIVLKLTQFNFWQVHRPHV